jgi:hypothetical protein
MPAIPGPPPKPAGQRARRNKDPIATTVLQFVHGEQPYLPADVDWHPQTIEWWQVWARTPLAQTFTETDWQVLLETALLHTAFWNGNFKNAPELRLRVAKFGATPEDRARLRIVFADADEKDSKRSTSSGQPDKGSTYGSLRALRPPTSS